MPNFAIQFWILILDSFEGSNLNIVVIGKKVWKPGKNEKLTEIFDFHLNGHLDLLTEINVYCGEKNELASTEVTTFFLVPKKFGSFD